MALSKKIVNVFLALLLLLATTGVTLNKHYCMGRLKSVAVFEHAVSCMGAGNTDPMPCCEDVHEVLKVDQMAKVSVDFKFHSFDFQLPTQPFFELVPVGTSNLNLTSIRPHGPPLLPDNILILHQVFRI